MELKRVKLKPNSPEFAEDEEDHDTSPHPACDMPGCGEPAMHRAPKSRGLNDYYNFCLQHVQDYNRAWNFFEGMSPNDIEEHMKNNAYGHRPTWNHTRNRETEEDLRRSAYEFRGFEDFGARSRKDNQDQEEKRRRSGYENTAAFSQSAEAEAMAIMGLEPPLELATLKTKYKELAKKHHPDLNRDDPAKAEEMFKKINMSYTVLKLAYERYREEYEAL